MKKIFIIALMMLTIGVSAQNYSFFENDVRLRGDSETVTLTHFGEFQLTKNFGITDYVSVENNQLGNAYGQVLLGAYCKAIPNLTTSVFVGKETLTNQARLAGYVNYTTGDKLIAYAFYQKNVNESYDSEWYDLRLRYAPYSTKKNSVYIGARYMRYYGVGIPVGFRQSLGDKGNAYVSYTTYYDCTIGTSDSDSERWVPTISLNLELF